MTLKDDGVEQSGLVGVNSKCGIQSKVRCESHKSRVCTVRFSACGCQEKSVVYEMECRHVAVQRCKQDQNHLQHSNTYCLSYRTV